MSYMRTTLLAVFSSLFLLGLIGFVLFAVLYGRKRGWITGLTAIGGTALPALGFGMGDVVIGELLRARGLIPDLKSGPDFWIAADSDGSASRTAHSSVVSALAMSGTPSSPRVNATPSNLSSRREANFAEMSACS